MNSTNERPFYRLVRAYALAWLTLLAGFLVSGTVAWWFWGEAERIDRVRFQITVTNLVEQLNIRIDRYAEELERFAEFLGTQPEVTENVWESCIQRPAPPSNLPAFLELAYVTNPSLLPRAEVEVLLKTHSTPSGKAFLPKLGPRSLWLTRHWRNGCMVTPKETEAWLQHPQVTAQWWPAMGWAADFLTAAACAGTRWKLNRGGQPFGAHIRR